MASSAEHVRHPRLRPSPEELAFYTTLDRAVTAGALGRAARAGELHARASVQAEGLYGENSLVLACSRWSEASSHIQLANASAGDDEKSLRYRAWALQLQVNALLLRRAAANTLLPGTVSREEVEYRARVNDILCKAKGKPAPPESKQQKFGERVGISALVHALNNTLNLLGKSKRQRWPAAEAETAQAFVLAALDFLPRTAGFSYSESAEATLLCIVEKMSRRDYDNLPD